MLNTLKAILKRQLHSYDRTIIFRPASLSLRSSAVLQLDLRMLLAELSLTSESLTVVQVGAFDGTSDDPLANFLPLAKMRGILLEPQPAAFALLEAKYANNPNVTTLNVAISENDGTSTLYVVDGKTVHDPPWCNQIASMSRDHVLRHARWIPDLANRTRAIEVTTLSPETLIKTQGLHRVDALIVDAEGADWKIVNAFFAANAIPSVLQFEWKHLHHTVISTAIEQLADLRFNLEFVGPDIIARRIEG